MPALGQRRARTEEGRREFANERTWIVSFDALSAARFQARCEWRGAAVNFEVKGRDSHELGGALRVGGAMIKPLT